MQRLNAWCPPGAPDRTIRSHPASNPATGAASESPETKTAPTNSPVVFSAVRPAPAPDQVRRRAFPEDALKVAPKSANAMICFPVPIELPRFQLNCASKVAPRLSLRDHPRFSARPVAMHARSHRWGFVNRNPTRKRFHRPGSVIIACQFEGKRRYICEATEITHGDHPMSPSV